MSKIFNKYCLISAFALVASPSVFANGGWAVIVWNPQTDTVGSFHGASARADAESGALNYCGTPCAGITPADLESGSPVKETFVLNGWIALATDNVGHFGSSGVHDSQTDAEAAALQNCGNSACYVVRSLSSFVASPDIDGTNNLHLLPGQPVTPPAPAGYYCASACANSAGAIDYRYSVGATGASELEARQNSINATQSEYSCNFNVLVVGCEIETHGRVDAAEACTDSSGNADLRYVVDAQGGSELEAKTNARAAAQSEYSCNFGMSDYSVSVGIAPTYCSVACLDSSGNPDLRYTQGARGNNVTEATVSALNDAQNAYSCNFGLKVLGCNASGGAAIFDAAAACKSSSGAADLRYIADGQGSSLLEAETNARAAVQSADSCNFGLIDVTHSTGLRAAYCTAACLDSSGAPDQRYSMGANGRDLTDATVKALSATQSQYSCNLGIQITACN